MSFKNVKDCNEYRDPRNRNGMQLQMSWVLGGVLDYTKSGWVCASLAKSADFSDVLVHAAKSTRLAGTMQLLCVDSHKKLLFQSSEVSTVHDFSCLVLS